MNDPIIDRSPEQKQIRLAQLKVELFKFGYTAVSVDWLKDTLAFVERAKRETA